MDMGSGNRQRPKPGFAPRRGAVRRALPRLALGCLDGILRRMTTSEVSVRRSRAIYALAALLVIGTGLLWRSGWLPLPSALAKYGGDALWALMVFLGLGFALPRSSTTHVALIAVGFAWSVEFLQLYHAPWIDGIRATLLGRLVLGSTFNSPDLLAYVIGIGLGAFAEWILAVRGRPRGQALRQASGTRPGRRSGPTIG